MRFGTEVGKKHSQELIRGITMNRYYCSDGTRVSESAIKSRLTAAYRKHYVDTDGVCEGCGGRAEGTAHIVPKARCKVLHKTEYIWNPVNWFKACHKCNLKAETSQITTLMNYKRILAVIELIDPEKYRKLI